MIYFFHFGQCHVKDMIKKKRKEKKKERGLNILKDVILKNIVTKESSNISFLMCLIIFI